MDEDLDRMSREELIAEVRRLRDGIRQHRDSSGHDLCWHHPGFELHLVEDHSPDALVEGWASRGGR